MVAAGKEAAPGDRFLCGSDVRQGSGSVRGAGKLRGAVRVGPSVTGTWVLLATVALSLVAGVAHRRRDGRLRPARAGRRAVVVQAPNRMVTAGTADPAGTAGTAGAADPASPAEAGAADPGDLRPLLVGLGHTPGEQATLVQFSSAFCAPCRATRRILAEVSALVPGVAHLEIDAESQLALVRQLRILKTPTTLVLDASGREVKRATGAPRKADVIAAVGSALP